MAKEPVTFKVTPVYERKCAYHPERVENLWYVYNGIPDERAGQLLCEECRQNEQLNPYIRTMSSVPAEDQPRESSLEVSSVQEVS